VKVNEYDVGEYAEETRRSNFGDEFRSIREEFMAPLEESDLLIDLGCGPCHDTSFFSDQIEDVVGIDKRKSMLQHGAREYGCQQLIAGDMTHIPVNDGSADAVWANASVFSDADDQGIVRQRLGEMQRITSKGGTIHVSFKTGRGDSYLDDYDVKNVVHTAEEVEDMIERSGMEINYDRSRKIKSSRSEFRQWYNVFAGAGSDE
jgi:ubiquinone/menaquinone biosynthesis C-methylase UbiE